MNRTVGSIGDTEWNVKEKYQHHDGNTAFHRGERLLSIGRDCSTHFEKIEI